MSTAVFVSLLVMIVGSIETSYQSSLLVTIQLAPIFIFGYFFGLLVDNFKKKLLWW